MRQPRPSAPCPSPWRDVLVVCGCRTRNTLSPPHPGSVDSPRPDLVASPRAVMQVDELTRDQLNQLKVVFEVLDSNKDGLLNVRPRRK